MLDNVNLSWLWLNTNKSSRPPPTSPYTHRNCVARTVQSAVRELHASDTARGVTGIGKAGARAPHRT
jgi:hypothetical protein